MVAAGAGSIVNLSGGGIGGPGVPPRASAYTSSKAAVAVLTETLAGELAGTGVRVNAVAPGNTPTGFMREVLAVGPDRAGSALFETARSQDREHPEPIGLEAMVLFLLSDDAAWVTGRLLSARRDPIDSLVARRAVIERSSLYRLRRIDADLYHEASEMEQEQ
jgi:NAD(P)-dependent dehydrogenase (short-subunit alcohol dehydrogenase family)